MLVTPNGLLGRSPPAEAINRARHRTDPPTARPPATRRVVLPPNRSRELTWWVGWAGLAMKEITVRLRLDPAEPILGAGPTVYSDLAGQPVIAITDLDAVDPADIGETVIALLRSDSDDC